MVTVERGALATVGARVARVAPAHRYAVLSDTTVAGIFWPTVLHSFGEKAVELFTIPPGEHHKTRESWAMLTDQLLAHGYARDTTVVALGGGVVGDLAGFVAATYMRGVPVVQVPTTLQAMIDASIGGKTGVDTPAGKNLVGAFHQPAEVIIDPTVLESLPPRQLNAGMAEAIKHGVIASAEYFRLVSQPADMADIIAGSVRIKTEVVARDVREGGLRRVLNFGHTIGHAIETLSRFDLLHGEAVAIGMVIESRLAERLTLAERGTAEAVCAAVGRSQLPTALPAGMRALDIVSLTHSDKKVRKGRVEYALPRAIGAMAGADTGWGIAVDDDDVIATLAQD
jgi:3-dehydroquinate synthase